MMAKVGRELKTRPDGTVNITLDPNAVKHLDEVATQVGGRLGFEMTRSQAIRYLIKHYLES